MAFEIKHGHGIPFAQKHGLGSQPMGPLVMTEAQIRLAYQCCEIVSADNGNGKAHDWVMKIQSVLSSASPYYVIAHLLSLSLSLSL
jgi:hypothetical protein